MLKFRKPAVIFFLIAALVIIPFGNSAFAEEKPAKEASESEPIKAVEQKDVPGDRMIADAIFLRPLGFMTTVATTFVFVIGLPFSLIGGNTKASYNKLVAEPAAYTFNRPLGEF